MSTDLLAGIAAGFGYAGDRITENAKSKLEEKLEKDREDRAEERQKAREARMDSRERQKVTGKRRYQEEGGVWREVGTNSYGDDVGEARLLNAAELSDISVAEQKKKDEARRTSLELTLAEKKLGDYDTDKGLDRKLKEAQIGSENRQYTPGSRSSGGGGSTKPQYNLDGTPVTKTQFKNALGDQIYDEGAAPKGVAGYVAKRLMDAQEGGGDYNYKAPKYEALDGSGKEKADQLSAIMIAAAKKIDSGELTRAEAVAKIKKATGVTRSESDFDSWIKIARGR